MFEKLERIKTRYEQLSEEIATPEVIANQELWRKLMKEHADLEETVQRYEEYLQVQQEIGALEELCTEESDAELLQMAQEETAEAKKRRKTLEEELKVLLLPKDPNDEKNVVLEIRAGTGGEEAALFGANLPL